jgi:hypothetical protein
MPFPTVRFQIGPNSIITAEDLRIAQDFLPDLFRRYGQAEWLAEPIGYIGALWLEDTDSAAAELIVLAKALNSAERCVHDSSRPFLLSKLTTLLNGSPDEKRYLENITELQVMAAFGPNTVHLEPATPRDHSAGDKPPGPDFGLEIAGFPFDVEVTVLHPPGIDGWSAATAQLRRRVSEQLQEKGGLFRMIGFQTRWVFQDQNVPRRTVDEIVRRIAATSTGTIDLNEFGIEGSVEWYPEAPTKWSHLVGPIPPGAIMAVGSTQWMMFADGDQDLIADALEESVRRTFQRKRRQVRDGTPCLLLVRPGHRWITAAVISDAIERRIWKNHIHDAVSGAAIYVHSEDLIVGGGSVSVSLNPRARHPIPTDVFRVLTGLAEARKRTPQEPGTILSLGLLMDPRVDLLRFLSEFLNTPFNATGPDIAPLGAYSPGHDVQIHYLGRRRGGPGKHPTMLFDFAIVMPEGGFGILAVHLIEKVLRKKRTPTSPLERPQAEARLWINRREAKSDDDVFAILREAVSRRPQSKTDVESKDPDQP